MLRIPESLALFATLFCTSACITPSDWLVVEAEVDDVCVVDITVDMEPVAGDVSTTVVLDHDDIGIDLGDTFDASVFLKSAQFYALAGIEDFDMVEHLRVAVSLKGEDSVDLLNIDNPDGTIGAEWYVESASTVDLATYLDSPDLELIIEFDGTLPEKAWSMGLDVCFSAKVAYRESL